MQKTVFDGYLKASADQTHPLQTNIEFVFTDFHPNKNRQGVPRLEAENIIRTGLNMPVKANFAGGRIHGHSYALPVGPIVAMEQKGDQIIGRAIVWKDEFEEFTNYLEKASASEGGVQFSWELYYGNSDVDAEGVTWLHDCIVAGAAIVADPAYGGRTPLIALAEVNNMELDQLKAQVSELQDRLWSMMDALYAALALPGAVDRAAGIEEQFTQVVTNLKGMAEAKQQSEASLAEAKSEVDTAIAEKAKLESELEDLRQYKQTVEADKAKAELLGARRDSLKDVMSGEEFDGKVEFILGLSEEQFGSYKDSLVAAVSRVKSSASTKAQSSVLTPDPIGGSSNGQPSLQDLAGLLREVRNTKR